jgi:hypothetical protein
MVTNANVSKTSTIFIAKSLIDVFAALDFWFDRTFKRHESIMEGKKIILSFLDNALLSAISGTDFLGINGYSIYSSQ